MPEHFLFDVIRLLEQHGYALVVPLSMFGGSAISIIAGFLISIQVFNGPIVFILLLVGDVLGDTLYYWLGRLGRHGFINKYGKYFGVTDARVERLEAYFNKHDWKVLLIGKTQPIGLAILFSAGMTRMNYWKFLGYNILGSIPKIIVFMLVGFHLGKGLHRAYQYVDYFGIISFLTATVLIGSYFLAKRYFQIKDKTLKKIIEVEEKK